MLLEKERLIDFVVEKLELKNFLKIKEISEKVR